MRTTTFDALRALVREVEHGGVDRDHAAMHVARYALQAHAPVNLSERLERMARAADRSAEDLLQRSIMNQPADVDVSLPLLMASQAIREIAGILRAGADPSEPLREENIRG